MPLACISAIMSAMGVWFTAKCLAPRHFLQSLAPRHDLFLLCRRETLLIAGPSQIVLNRCRPLVASFKGGINLRMTKVVRQRWPPFVVRARRPIDALERLRCHVQIVIAAGRAHEMQPPIRPCLYPSARRREHRPVGGITAMVIF